MLVLRDQLNHIGWEGRESWVLVTNVTFFKCRKPDILFIYLLETNNIQQTLVSMDVLGIDSIFLFNEVSDLVKCKQ